jgi:recombination protein RecT
MAQPQPQPSTAIVVPRTERLAKLKDLFESKRDAIAAVVPKHVTPERLIKITLSALSRNPDLLECTRESIFLSVIQAAELGLEFGSTLGHAYLVPFRNNKINAIEAMFIPGYRGLIALARRSGQILSIEAHVVYEKDHFRVRYGLEPVLEHEPCFDGEPGKVRLAYAVSILRDGAKQVEVMSLSQLDAIRRRSKAGDSGPWVTDTDEMYRKTVVRRLWKYLPMSTEMAKVAEADDFANGSADPPDLSDLLSPSEFGASPTAAPAKGAASVKAKLGAKATHVKPVSDEPEPEAAAVPEGYSSDGVAREPGSDG